MPYQVRPLSAMTDGGAIQILQIEEESKRVFIDKDR
jgi:hypothetical protein